MVILYMFIVLFSTILIDIRLTVRFRDRGNFAIAAFATIPLYFLMTFLWTIILGRTVTAFSGQGAIGLTIILGFGLVFSILRAIWELLLFIDFKRR